MSKIFKKRYLLKKPPELLQGPPGPQGPPGSGSDLELPISSDDIDYRGVTLTQKLDDLSYVELVINSFATPVINFEIGQVITSLGVTWSYNKSVSSQTITGPITPVVLTAAERSRTLSVSNQSDNFTLVLSALDERALNRTRNLSINFLNKIYWGQANQPGSINSAFVISLQNELKGNRQKSFNVNLGANVYAWFAHPVSYGVASVKTNGFDGGFNAPITISFTNASGFTEDYYVYRSEFPNLGVTNVEFL
jgi:hypothetical protein